MMLRRVRCKPFPAIPLLALTTLFSLWTFLWHQNIQLATPADHLPSTHPEVLQALRTTYLLPPSTLPYNLSRDPTYLVTSHLDTWGFIHHYLTRLFEGERGGFFVEAGALDGQQLSNTLWLEQELAWTGLLIEPNPYSFQHLRHKHRKAWTSNSCISSDSFTKRSVHVSKNLRPGYAKSKWFVRGSSYELGVTMVANESENLQYFLNTGDETYLMAYCFPLHSYLLALNVTTIDMLSLDTQGSEIDIIKSIPWEGVNIRTLVVEVLQPPYILDEFVEYMSARGYVLVGEYQDYIFVKREDPAYARLTSHRDWYLKVREVNGSILMTTMFAKPK